MKIVESFLFCKMPDESHWWNEEKCRRQVVWMRTMRLINGVYGCHVN
jgi:hypothetical protein